MHEKLSVQATRQNRLLLVVGHELPGRLLRHQRNNDGKTQSTDDDKQYHVTTRRSYGLPLD